MDRQIAQAATRLKEWRACPPKFVRECCGATPDPWQDDALEAFPDQQRIAMKACVGPGKSALLAWMALNFAATRPYPKIAAVSITWPNLMNNLWAELAKWIRHSPFLQEVLQWTHTRVFAKEAPEEWWISARAWDRSADAEKQGQALAGLHADYAMGIADESGGIPSAVLAAAEGILATGKETKLIQAGNPTHLSGPLFDACHSDRAIWHVIEITGDPDAPNRAPRVALRWAQEMIRKYGRDSTIARVRVLGLFPREASDALIGLDMMEDSYGATEDPFGVKLTRGVRTLGADIARFGTDKNVVIKRDGCFADGWEEWGGKDTVVTSNRIHTMALDWRARVVAIDDVGIGGAVTDNLHHRERPYQILPVNVGNKAVSVGPDGEDIYANLKAELGLWMREEWFGARRISLDPRFKSETSIEAEATDTRYGFGRLGRVYQIESKDDYRKRHNGDSPDFWDALVLAFAADKLGLQDFGGWG
jgi:hypothetical protein